MYSLQCNPHQLFTKFEMNYKILLRLTFKSFQDHCHLQIAHTNRTVFNSIWYPLCAFKFQVHSISICELFNFLNLFCSVRYSRICLFYFTHFLTLNYKYAIKKRNKSFLITFRPLKQTFVFFFQ